MPSLCVQIHVFQLCRKVFRFGPKLRVTTTSFEVFRIPLNSLTARNLNESYAEYSKIDENCVRMSQMLFVLFPTSNGREAWDLKSACRDR